MSKIQTLQAPAGGGETRGDATRQKLLAGGIDVFGRYGFDGATTRMLAAAAGVNLQAIPYYFGGKEGLYLAVADHIGETIAGRVGAGAQPARERVEALKAGGSPLEAEEARALLLPMLLGAAELFTNPDSAPWARFMIREQMEPTEAFRRIYARVMQPMLGIARVLVGVLLAAPADSEAVKLRAMSLVGSVLILRIAEATVMTELGWSDYGPDQMAVVRAMVCDQVMALGGAREPASGRSKDK